MSRSPLSSLIPMRTAGAVFLVASFVLPVYSSDVAVVVSVILFTGAEIVAAIYATSRRD